VELAVALTIRREDLWVEAFFEALSQTGGRVTVAANLAGVHRVTVYRRIRSSEEFRSRVDAVMRRLRDARTERTLQRSIR